MNPKQDELLLDIHTLQGTEKAETCARLMAASEPWITLGRTYESCLQTVTDPTREVYVAMMQAEVAGFIILNMHGAFVGYIQTLCIAPAWRSRGLGARLIKFAEKRIFAEAPNVFICVSSFNPRAKALYERLGYQTVGELTDYIVPGHSEILLRKTVGSLTTFRRGASRENQSS